MATQAELLAEAGRRGLLTPERQALVTEAQNRGLLGGDFTGKLLQGQLASQQVQPSEGAGFGISAKAGLVTDPQTRLRLFAEEMFPNDPNAESRFGVVDGEEVFINDQGQLQKIQGGFGDIAGDIASSTPEIVGGVVGAFASGGNPIVAEAVGAVGGNAVKRIFSAFALDEPQTTTETLKGFGQEAAFSLIGGKIAQKATSVVNQRLANRSFGKLTPEIQEQAIKTRESVFKETGIELDLAQITNLPSLKAMKKWAAKFPGEASNVLQNLSDVQSGQAESAIARVVRSLSDNPGTDIAGQRAINAASASIEGARIQRGEIVAPFYRKAFETGGEVDVTPVISQIDGLMRTAKGSNRKALISTRKLMNEANFDESAVVQRLRRTNPGLTPEQITERVAQEGLDTSLEGLHGSKLALDALIDGAQAGSNSIDNVTLGQLVGVKGMLLKQLNQASPLYTKASAQFEQLSRQLVDPLQDSIVGVLARIQPQNASRAAAKIFSGENVSPASVGQAMKAIRSQKNGNEIWDGVVASWMTQNLDKALKELQGGTSANVAGKFRQAVFGRPSQKTALNLALRNKPEVFRQFNIVMDAFQMLARTPISGSDTAFNQLITKEMSEGGLSAVQKALTPKNSILEFIAGKNIEDNAKIIVDAIVDPRNADELKRLGSLPAGREKSLEIATFILGSRVAEQSAESLPSSTQITPPIAQ